MTTTTTTTISEMVQSEWISPAIQMASKDAAVVFRFAKDHDRTEPGAAAKVRLVREVSDVDDQNAIDALDQAEGDDITATAFNTTDVEFDPSEYGIARDVTDDSVEDGVLGMGLYEYLVTSAGQDLAIGFDDDLASLLAGFSTTVGTSGQDMELADMAEAVSKLDDANMNEGGGAVFVLGANQKFNLLTKAQAGQGTLLADFVSIAGSEEGNPASFVGRYLQYPIWYSTLTDTANTGDDTTGALFVRGDEGRNPRSAAIATSVKRHPRPELDRDASGRITEVVVTMRRGSAENIDDSGVSIVTTV